MEVESRITEVTLYARGARVRRVATIALAEASPRVRIVGLPVAVIDDTVRIEAEGGGLVTAVHVGLDAPASDAAAGEDAPEVRGARHRAALADAEVERIDGALAVLAAAKIVASSETDEPPPAWSAIVDARRALVALRTERELAMREAAAAARREAEEARRALTAVLDRDRRAGSARTAKLHELRKHVDLELAGSGTRTIALEYQVAAARWVPSYVARLAGDSVAFELRASVAHDTGEDWTGVVLRLSTAEPERFGALPELAAQRIGRRQAEPPRTGFRAPPSGAQALYHDYVRAFPSGDPARIGLGRIASDDAALSTEVWDEESSRAKPAYEAPPAAGPMPAAEEVATMLAGEMSPVTRSRGFFGATAGRKALANDFDEEVGEGGGGRAEPAEPPRPPAPPPRLDYANLRMASPGSALRGTLVPAARDYRAMALDGEVAASAARIHALALPSGCSADWPHTYDYAYATDGAVDVRADGAWHSIAVTAKPSTARLHHVAVPRLQADVFRIAAIANPLGGPLLPGPIDVYDRGSFVVTSSVDHTPPGAEVEIGLGVDATIKLSRNTEFREETTGVLRGGLRLHHAIAIDIDNLSDRAIDLEVRERLPVTREGDDDVEVIAGRIEPPWQRWTPDPGAPSDRRLRGGYRWRLSVPAGARRALRAAYEVKIAGKLELVGGNRRES